MAFQSRFSRNAHFTDTSVCDVADDMSLYMLSHIAAWTQGRPLLPALRNSGRFLTIPLSGQSLLKAVFRGNMFEVYVQLGSRTENP